MRPTLVSYTPADDNLTGFLSNATGATWTLTANDAGDSMAHLVSIRNDTANDHSAKTATLTGTDAEGKTQTETMALPAGSATTTSTKYFKTLTTVVPSATIGADTMDIGWTDDVVSPVYPLDWASSAAANISVDISGTINFTIQETFADVLKAGSQPSTVPWSNISALASKTADTTGQATVGATGFRILVNSLTAGATIAFYTNQSVRHY